MVIRNEHQDRRNTPTKILKEVFQIDGNIGSLDIVLDHDSKRQRNHGMDGLTKSHIDIRNPMLDKDVAAGKNDQRSESIVEFY